MPATYAQGEEIVVSGTIVDKTNQPIIGAQVFSSDKSIGTATNSEGKFELNIAQGETLTVSYIGYSDYNFIATPKENNIVLETSSLNLDELVVIAYGSQKKRDIVGSVATVKSDDLVAVAGGNFQTALQGSAAGIQVVSSTIDGTAPQIKIRGVSSISSDTDPLWVIDGMIGGQNDVNMNDIESINIMKDASATTSTDLVVQTE